MGAIDISKAVPREVPTERKTTVEQEPGSKEDEVAAIELETFKLPITADSYETSKSSMLQYQEDLVGPENDNDDDDEYYRRPEQNIHYEVFSEYREKLLYQLKRVQSRNPKVAMLIKGFILTTIALLIGYSFVDVLRFDEAKAMLQFNRIPINTVHTPLHKIIFPHIHEIYPSMADDASEPLFDPRFAPAALLMNLTNQVRENGMKLEKDFKIPFSWGDWVDLESKLKPDARYLADWLYSHADEFMGDLDLLSEHMDCKHFCLLFGCEGDSQFDSQCRDYKPDKDDNDNDYKYGFEATGPCNTRFKEPGRILYAGSYVKLHMPPPARIYMMDVFGDDGEGSLMVAVDPELNPSRKPLFRNKIAEKKFIADELNGGRLSRQDFHEHGWTIEPLRMKLYNILSQSDIEKVIPKEGHSQIDEDETFLAIKESDKKDEPMKLSHWSKEDFLRNEEEFMNDLASKDTGLDKRLYSHLAELDEFRTINERHPKYLQEASLYGTDLGAHFDWRFFSGSFILNDYRQSVIHRLGRTWLRFCLENGIKSFTAYGSMLGWIRNGLTLPWDGDIDVIVTVESLNLLARNFNQTLIIDYSKRDEFQTAMTGYLIDINPAYYSRVRGDGGNVIDGRLIDISTGIYLDITALAWTEGYLKGVAVTSNMKKLIDKDYDTNKNFAVEGEVYEKTVREELEKTQEEKQLVHCKNNMAYTVEELSTMVPSYFEGARAYFPHSFEKIIWRLYPTALTRITEPNHVYDKVFNLWLNTYDCPGLVDENGNALENAVFGQCNNPEVVREAQLTRNYTTRHVHMMEEKGWERYELKEDTEMKPFRIDEFFVLYATRVGLTEDQLYRFYL